MDPISFRPTEDSLKALEAIKQARGCNQSQAINAALVECDLGAPLPVDAVGPTFEDPDVVTKGKITVKEREARMLALGQASAMKLTRKAPKPGWKA